MKELSRKSFFDTKRAAFFLLTLLANVALVFPLRYSRMVWILPLAVFLDFRFAFLMKRLLTPKKELKRLIDSINPLLDDLRFAIPTNQEIYMEPTPTISTEVTNVLVDESAVNDLSQVLHEEQTDLLAVVDSSLESAASDNDGNSSKLEAITDMEPPIKSTSIDESSTSIESTAEPTLPRPKRIIPCAPDYHKPILPPLYSDDLALYLANHGFSMDKNLVREWFAAMATSKLILIRGENPSVMHRLFELTADFLGASLTWDDSLVAARNGHDESIHYHSMFDLFCAAHEQPKHLHYLGFKDVESAHLDSTFRDLVDYALNPLLPHRLTKDPDQPGVEIPQNLWFFFFLKPTDESRMTERLMQSASTIEWNAKLVTPIDEVRQNPQKLSQEAFAHLLLDGNEHHFFEESDWKKIDQIERFASQQSTFSLDNRIFRQLERFTSAYLLFGGDKTDAIDSILYLKLLPLIELAIQTGTKKSDEDILSVCERLYGLEHLPRSKPLLKQMISNQKSSS